MNKSVRKKCIKDGFREYGDGTYLKIEVRLNERGSPVNVITRRHADGTTMYIKEAPHLCLHSV